MSDSADSLPDAANIAAITRHLMRCDAQFVPALSSRVDIAAYAQKIVRHARLFTRWQGSELVGLVAAYWSPGQRDGFITNVSVLPESSGMGIAGDLLNLCIADLAAAGAQRIALEVGMQNHVALRLYQRHGFIITDRSTASVVLHLALSH